MQDFDASSTYLCLLRVINRFARFSTGWPEDFDPTMAFQVQFNPGNKTALQQATTKGYGNGAIPRVNQNGETKILTENSISCKY